jgi:membrane-associated phospholipid phosphatase
MVPTPSPLVKPAWANLCARAWQNPQLRQQFAIWLPFGGLALLLWLTGWDTTLAQTFHHADSSSAWAARQYATIPGMVLALLGLIAMLWPGLWQSRPLLYRTAAVMALTAILGVGFLNQLVVKNIAERPRPRETVLLESQGQTPNPDAFSGNSMPSGHAAMGFVLAAPFFPLRRRYPLVASTILYTGLAAGAVIGASRMVLGAHYATDVLIAGALTLSPAAALTWWLEGHRRIRPALIGAGAILVGLVYVLGNHFDNYTLTRSLTSFQTIELPCLVQATHAAPGTPLAPAVLTVRLNGYGAPVSNLQLIDNNGYITLQTHLGLYHSLSCTATLALPAAE